MPLDLVSILPTGLIAVLWYLYKKKEDKTDEALKMLWNKHDSDAQALQDLKLSVIAEHYKKGELDNKFNKLEHTIEKSLSELGCKFDRLSEILANHAVNKTKDHQ